MADIWERQPGEPVQAFHAFRHYRDLGDLRTIDKAALTHRTLCKTKQADGGVGAETRKRAPQIWWKWSTLYRWVDRVAAYDAHVDKEARAAAEAKILKRREQQAEQLAIVRSALMAPAIAVAELFKDPTFLANIRKMSEEDLLVLLTRASAALPAIINTERLVMGEATQRIETDGRADGNLADTLRTDPEAARLLNEFAARLANAGANGSDRVGE